MASKHRNRHNKMFHLSLSYLFTLIYEDCFNYSGIFKKGSLIIKIVKM